MINYFINVFLCQLFLPVWHGNYTRKVFIRLTYMFKYVLSHHTCDNKLNSEGRYWKIYEILILKNPEHFKNKCYYKGKLKSLQL